MKPGDQDGLWEAMEGLRDRPVIAEARRYAYRWARTRRRIASFKAIIVGPRPALVFAAIPLAVAGAGLLSLMMQRAPDVIETGDREIRTNILSDGSTVMLNTNSRVRVAFTEQSRTITLLAGEAHFEVAKDPLRPFLVRADHTEVVAVGTVFDVAKSPTETKVTLIEGHVDVRAVAEGESNARLIDRLQPAQQLALAQDGHVLAKTTARVEDVTAWQHGLVVLDDVPLGEALAQINRYSAPKIAMSDPTLAMIRVSGVFRSGDTKAFIAAVERYFGLKGRWDSERSVVLEKP